MWSWSPISLPMSKRRRVVEALTGLAQQERLRVEPGLLLVRQLRQHRRLGRLKHAIEPAQHREGQDDLAVVGLLVIAPQQVGDGPDEGGKRLVVQRRRPGQFRPAGRRRANHRVTLRG